MIWGEELKRIWIYNPKNIKSALFPFSWAVFSKNGMTFENNTVLTLFYLSDKRIKFKTEAAYFLKVKTILLSAIKFIRASERGPILTSVLIDS